MITPNSKRDTLERIRTFFQENLAQAPNWFRRTFKVHKYGKDKKRWKLPRTERVRLAKQEK